jgi:acyl carrier protein
MQVSGRDRLPLLIQLLQQEFARVLGVSSADAVEPRRGFFEMGFDSLMVTELKTRLERALGHPLSATLSFNYPTIVSLATYLLHDVLQLETHEGEVPLATVPDPSAELLHTLENLSEAETEARLLEKLNAL